MTTDQRAALANVITIEKDILHGTPCFTGTRLPVQTLIDFLETGEEHRGLSESLPLHTAGTGACVPGTQQGNHR
jgi:uncharacterized protein (DUF433 family)